MSLRIACLLALPATLAAQGRDYQLTGPEVAVWNVAGTLRVEGGTGDAVRVTVDRQGADASRLKVEVGDVRGRSALRVIYPQGRVVYPEGGRGRSWGGSRAKLRVKEDGTFDGGWGGRGDEVEVVSDGRGLEAHADIRVSVPKGKLVDLHLAVGTATVTNVDGDIRVDVHSADVTTSHTRGRLVLDTGSGEVRVTDAEGEIDLDTGSGQVTVEGVRGDHLRMDTGSGRVSAGDVRVSSLGLDTGSGSVTLRTVSARDLAVDSGSGSVELDLVDDVDRMTVESGSGSVTIGVPASLGAELSVETGSGGIDLGIPVTVRRAERRSLRGAIGDGRGTLRIETGSGGVRLRATR